ncbi:integral membrane protein 2B [Anastrepha obliqua]|uniref:integral membrane protein 2B n=1 Tax=Anastrepha ludens TaxID=28586 RepID=UPI0023B12362|nr:integral membrane protein 2B [Anastrepha ludens]XP_054742000.1 integral membrane protein 2B [Anastrepha obliqua]
MTILTKPSNEKKAEKVPLPLALGGHDDASSFRGGVAHTTLLSTAPYHGDADAESMVFNRPPGSCFKTLLLFLIAVVVMMMGLLGGYTLYRAYAPTASNLHYRALCDIPYMQTGNISVPRLYEQNDELDWRNLFSRLTNFNGYNALDDDYFREEIELDMSDNESYAKIDVPDFKDGRRGRFMHDFKENQSAIIDTTANRCFIMPLDRDTTLPPKSFLDLMQKMGSGYYNIDTDRVRRKMRVVMPPINDLSMISERIANECYEMKVYMLENYVSGVFKREAKPVGDSGKFAEFMGKGVVEFDLINIGDIEQFEKK